MAYIHKKPIVPHSRDSIALITEGEGRHKRVVGAIRPGSWGSMPRECKFIESYQAGNKLCGPYTIDHVPGGGDNGDGIWKVFYNDNFVRYADREDINTIVGYVKAQADGDLLNFIILPKALMFSGSGQYGDTLAGVFDDVDIFAADVAPDLSDAFAVEEDWANVEPDVFGGANGDYPYAAEADFEDVFVEEGECCGQGPYVETAPGVDLFADPLKGVFT